MHPYFEPLIFHWTNTLVMVTQKAAQAEFSCVIIKGAGHYLMDMVACFCAQQNQESNTTLQKNNEFRIKEGKSHQTEGTCQSQEKKKKKKNGTLTRTRHLGWLCKMCGQT